MAIKIPNLRVEVNSFFDYDLTYLNIAHHVLLHFATTALTWDLYKDRDSSNKDLKKDRTYAISNQTLLFYALAFSARIADFFPFEEFSYDFAVCTGFALLFWLANIFWMFYNKGMPTSVTRSRLWINGTIAVTAALAYLFHFGRLLPFSIPMFCGAWSQYLEAVAMIPQLTLIYSLRMEGREIPSPIWISVHMTALARVFQLLNWAYLWFDIQMVDVLQVFAASFYLVSCMAFHAITHFIRYDKTEMDVVKKDQ